MDMMFRLRDVLDSLYGSANCRIEDEKITVWREDFDKPTEEQISAKLAELIAGYPLQELREKRNVLLASADWRDLPSYAGTKQAEWRVYRQSLRDMTSGLDTVEKVNAATFPTEPS